MDPCVDGPLVLLVFHQNLGLVCEYALLGLYLHWFWRRICFESYLDLFAMQLVADSDCFWVVLLEKTDFLLWNCRCRNLRYGRFGLLD